MDARKLVERIYRHVEAGAVDKAVVACLRLARMLGDTFNAAMFIRELYPDRPQLNEAFYEVSQHLKDDERNLVWKMTAQRWIEERTLDYSLDSVNDEARVLAMGVGELTHEADQMERSIQDFVMPPGMGEYDTAAFTDSYGRLKGQMRLKIRACCTILERVRTRCLNYATRIESQIRAAERATDFVGAVQIDVHNYYAERSESAFNKLRKAASLIGSSDPEDLALLLTSIRRAVKAVADHHFPPSADPVLCQDGQERILDEEKYLNRLQEFCAREFSRGMSTTLLRAELDYLSVFVRRLNEVASKGVHGEVSALEAKQGLLGLYMFLSNLIAKLSHDPSVQ